MVAGVRFERTFRGYEPRPGPGYRSGHPAKGCRGCKLLSGAGVHPAWRDRWWRRAEELSPTPCGAIGVRSRAGAPVRLTLLKWRTAEALIPSARGAHPISNRGRPRAGSLSRVWCRRRKPAAGAVTSRARHPSRDSPARSRAENSAGTDAGPPSVRAASARTAGAAA